MNENIKKIVKANQKLLNLNDYQFENMNITSISTKSKPVKTIDDINFEGNKIFMEIVISIPEFGKIDMSENNKKYSYIGIFIKGKPNGNGRKVDENDKTIWEGKWKNG